MNRKKIRIILMALLAVVFVVSVGMTIFQQIQYKKNIADTDEAARIAGLQRDTEPPRPTATPPAEKLPVESGAPADEPPPEEEPPEEDLSPREVRELAGIDLEALRAFNADVVGWITIPGTIVSYPLMQGKNDQYYLTHNWKREYSSNGSVYLECTAGRDLTNFHTIVYGHHMRNGTMFTCLENYDGENYWREHPSIYIVLDEVIYRYDIFSAREVSVSDIIYQFDIDKDHLEEEFLRYCTDQSVLDTGLTPGLDDRILTLSTCTSDLRKAYRWVVHGMLAEEYSRINI